MTICFRLVSIIRRIYIYIFKKTLYTFARQELRNDYTNNITYYHYHHLSLEFFFNPYQHPQCLIYYREPNNGNKTLFDILNGYHIIILLWASLYI